MKRSASLLEAVPGDLQQRNFGRPLADVQRLAGSELRQSMEQPFYAGSLGRVTHVLHAAAKACQAQYGPGSRCQVNLSGELD